MGILSPGTPSGPYRHLMQSAPAAEKPDGSHETIAPAETHGCDRCGKSRVKGSEHKFVTPARHEIVISPDLSVFLCDHHFREHELYVVASGYETRGA